MPVPSAKLTATGQEVKFGRIPATEDMKKRMVPLAPFVKRYGGKPPPATIDYGEKAKDALATMLNNDREGNCVIAAELHGVGVWSANEPNGRPRIPNSSECSRQYREICGPGDNGCYIPRVLEHFRTRGLLTEGTRSKIEGFVTVNPRDQLLVQYAVWLFGGLNLGVNWPSDWMGIRPGFVLQPTNSRIIGGHSVMVTGYDSQGLKISTWGIVGTLSWEALASPRWVDECYARLGEDWYSEEGMTAAGVDVEKLRKALQDVAAGRHPDIPHEPEPVPPVPPPEDNGEDWTGFLDFFGNPLSLRIKPPARTGDVGGFGEVDWWALIPLILTLLNAARRRDWVALASAVEELLAILGLRLGSAESQDLLRALLTRGETSVLTE